MIDIQQARDVLARWLGNVPTGRWEVTADGYVVLPTAPITHFINVASHEEVAPLIVGTAGNPDLLDALDYLLRHHGIVQTGSNVTLSTTGLLIERIAAAIIAADDRMAP
jgi:hypothetical protein